MIEFLTLITNVTLFFNCTVILRVHHAIFAFCAYLRSRYLRALETNKYSVNYMMETIQFPVCFIHLIAVLASEKKLRP